jgi:hypothetical protein
MTKQTKTLLVLSAVSLVISFTGVMHGQFLPISAVLFGLFMISKVLEKEAARFDEDQRSHQPAENSSTDHSSGPSHLPLREHLAKG